MEDAEAKLKLFRTTMTVDTNLPNQWATQGDDIKRAIEVLVRLLVPLVQDMYIAEVYLSLDAVEDGSEFFRQSLDEAATDQELLSRMLAYSQMLLFTGHHPEYAELVVNRLAPLLLRMQNSPDTPKSMHEIRRWVEEDALQGLAALAAMPLISEDFLRTLPAEQVEGHVKACRALREKATQPRIDWPWTSFYGRHELT